ncbi:hypothetical protein XENOCAPTIV_030844 [Xenoophorus captivus]|uniref:Uncharacterized protein n=1 Tax=Xenoophorus captivus TaxID=1517983 RepID=A0ABV0RMT4_9TELE
MLLNLLTTILKGDQCSYSLSCFHVDVFPKPLLFVKKFNKALPKIIEIKDLNVQYFYGPLDLSIHTIPILQGIT